MGGEPREVLRAIAAIVNLHVSSTGLRGSSRGRSSRPQVRLAAAPLQHQIEAAVRDLAAPTMVACDDQGRMLIAESGYRGGGNAKVSRIQSDGRRTVLVDDAAFGRRSR